MIDLADAHVLLAAPRSCMRVLLDRLSPDAVEPPTGAIHDCVESLAADLDATHAGAIIEHVFGVLPLVESFFDHQDGQLRGITSGEALGALGLFTPTVEHGWGAAALVGEPVGGGMRVKGEVRIPSRIPEGSLILVRVAEEDHRLAWLEHETAGVEWRDPTRREPQWPDSPSWLVVDGATVSADMVSQPVSLVPGEALHERLEVYASAWALFAAACARRGVRALRRAVRANRRAGESQASTAAQLPALAITEAEIQAELSLTAARCHLARGERHLPRGGGVIAALSAARALAAVAAEAAVLRDQLGLALEAPLATAGPAACLSAQLGGVLTLENELARVLDYARSTSPGVR